MLSSPVLFVQPFVRALASNADSLSTALDALRPATGLGRAPVALAYTAIAHWLERAGGDELGLRVGRAMHAGFGSAVDLAMRSAHSIRDAMVAANRYHSLFSDALVPRFSEEGDHAFIELVKMGAWPRAVANFNMSAWYAGHLRALSAMQSSLELWFSHDEPGDTTEYVRAFGSAQLRFEAPCYGFRFQRRAADQPLASGEPLLHALQCMYLESMLAGAPQGGGTTTHVRELLAMDFRREAGSAERVAGRMHMSRRTLVRRLRREGTSFVEQLEELRSELAVHLVATSALPLQAISDLLGFSHVQGFHRAFKRWIGVSANRHREAAAGRER